MASAPATRTGSDFTTVAARLRDMLEPFGKTLLLTAQGADGVKLERPPGGRPWDYVAGVRVGKTYVSYYLMPVYGLPELLAACSPQLRRRMQGKACFNFTNVDEAIFAELEALTARGIPPYLALPLPDRRS